MPPVPPSRGNLLVVEWEEGQSEVWWSGRRVKVRCGGIGGGDQVGINVEMQRTLAG
jgi:hypothetical protein